MTAAPGESAPWSSSTLGIVSETRPDQTLRGGRPLEPRHRPPARRARHAARKHWSRIRQPVQLLRAGARSHVEYTPGRCATRERGWMDYNCVYDHVMFANLLRGTMMRKDRWWRPAMLLAWLGGLVATFLFSTFSVVPGNVLGARGRGRHSWIRGGWRRAECVLAGADGRHAAARPVHDCPSAG